MNAYVRRNLDLIGLTIAGAMALVAILIGAALP